ncbi:conserved hypothetical protein [Segniliparus rotundus DSM 44985]|uniref:DUF3349 domain-containing protein n=1 Tax=Segniliparus rotundus (strain ATCC BAA-972 / CDC 1076 / CIP 108378 / DSM 44985 / JCM 13578) TaxID=640132 RepID=D6ZFN7_SEGRD|nr:DUF3349 domain-containing protein [Segniliparus rotundus]ADG97761.1 conserved hypothetical protein [Segniliparus rotundus DSM 44985]
MAQEFSLASVLRWLTAGYPEGVPAQDRIPLVALLRRKLSENQVQEVINALTAPDSGVLDDGVIDKNEISTSIHHVKGDEATQEDIERVAARLAASGWPLEEELSKTS